MIRNRLKELSELKKFKVQTILSLDYKKRNDCKIFHSITKLIASDSDIDECFINATHVSKHSDKNKKFC